MKGEIQIFRIGDYPNHGGEWNGERVAGIAESYNPTLHEAPFVIGHPEHDKPAYAWIERLRADENGRLFASIHDAYPGFLEMFSQGLPGGWKPYKKISAAFYPPDHKYNPTPGKFYLRHVGLLGGDPPAVKGMDTQLRAPEFADEDNGEGLVNIEFEFSDITGFSQNDEKEKREMKFFEKLKAALSKKGVKVEELSPEFNEIFEKELGMKLSDILEDSPPDDPPANDKTLPEDIQAKFNEMQNRHEKQVRELNEKISALEKSRSDDVAHNRAERINGFVETLMKEGKITPANEPQLRALLSAVSSEPIDVQFDEEHTEKVDPLLLAEMFLKSNLPKLIGFDELATFEFANDKTGADGEEAKTTDEGTEIAKHSSSFKETNK